MDIPLHASVECTDGHAGTTTAVILSPVNNQLTHVVIREAGLIGIQRLVPIELVRSTDAGHVVLHCTRAKLVDQEPFIVYDYVPSLTDMKPYSAAEMYYWRQPSIRNEDVTPIGYEHVPDGELALHRGSHVQAIDGRIGRIDDFVISPGDKHITHILLHEGHLWGTKEVSIPVSQIDHFDENTVYVKLSKQEIAALPDIQSQRYV